MVIHLAGNGYSLRAGYQIRTRTGVREHLDRNAGIIHRPQPLLADLGQQFDRVRASRRGLSWPESAAADGAGIDTADYLRSREMLLERHDAHGLFSPVGPSNCGI